MKKCTLAIVVLLLIFGHPGPTSGQDLGNIKNQKPFTIHGNLGLNLIAYGVNGIPAREQPFSFVLSASATASIYGIDLPFSIVLSDKQKSYSQPFNQYGMSPHWKWITLHLGYRNVTFSNFTLAGHTFVGAGAELNPGIFRFGFVWGRFDRKTTTNNVNTTDSLPNFSRKGYAVKVGVGTEKNFADLIVLRIHDDSTSITQSDTSTIRTPEQNVVTGINTRFTLVKNLVWETEAAFSLFTADLGADELSEIEDNSLFSFANKFFGINQSSSYSTAIRSALSYKGKGYSLKLEYKRIAPMFQSMGAYFFNNDLENITFSPSFGLFKRKALVSGSIGVQHDNLQQTKLATSWRYIGNVNLSVNPSSKWGVDASFSNYGINQKAGRLPLSDTLKVAQSNLTASLTPRVMIVNQAFSHMILLNYTFTSFSDQNKFTQEFANFNLNTAQLSYALGLIPTKWSFTAGLTWTHLNNQTLNTTGLGGTLCASKSLLKDRMNIAWNNAVSETKSGDIPTWIFNSNILATYRVGKHHSFRLNLYITGNYPGAGSPNPKFTEYKGDISYVFTF